MIKNIERLALFFGKFFKPRNQHRNIRCNNFPDDVKINFVVAMYQAMTHINDVAPRNLCMIGSIFGRHAHSGFAHNPQAIAQQSD